MQFAKGKPILHNGSTSRLLIGNNVCCIKKLTVAQLTKRTTGMVCIQNFLTKTALMHPYSDGGCKISPFGIFAFCDPTAYSGGVNTCHIIHRNLERQTGWIICDNIDWPNR